jgi:hypothetical protein
MMNMPYEHSQTGWIMLLVFSLIPISLTTSYLMLGESHLPAGVFLILLLLFVGILLTFYKLTVKADQQSIHLVFGLGLLHFKIHPQTVDSVKIINTPWYYGFGIRFTPRGMLYNVHGVKAVQITYRDSKTGNGNLKTVMIGTVDAVGLCEFIKGQYGL